LIHNFNGNYLRETEDMLIHFKASCAHEFYVRAIRICLDDADGYSAFMSNDQSLDSPVKRSLQLLSIEYLKTGVPFEVEVYRGLIAEMPKVLTWLGKRGVELR
jgi:hypothetical protein